MTPRLLRRALPALVALFAFTVVTGAVTGVAAAGKDGPGTKVVRKANDTISSLLAKKAAAGSKEEQDLATKVTSSVRDFLDIDELGQRALADQWAGLTDAQRTQYQALLRKLIEGEYVKGLRGNLDYKVVYKSEAKQDDGSIKVSTEIQAKKKGRPYTITIDYVLTKRDGKLRCYDVITDGAGLVENYRAQFNKIIAKDGFDGLIAKMQKKLGAS
ncbi:MAG: ABC transporter substrate-binding protein [Kofleriaceae bacterium]|nr:ABC transporter substrate-binding protein [Myxococcales bacterium]MCB9564005.1 ABC transporter substrate-binding protein [Kofleriaceae bacterium]